MTRIYSQAVLGLLGLLFLSTCQAPLDKRASLPDSVKRPNVLFILVDDLGFMDVEPNHPETFYETPNVHTPRAGGHAFHPGLRGQPRLLADSLQHPNGQVPDARGRDELLQRAQERPICAGTPPR